MSIVKTPRAATVAYATPCAPTDTLLTRLSVAVFIAAMIHAVSSHMLISSLKNETHLQLISDNLVMLRAFGRFSNEYLCVRPNRLLQMAKIPGHKPPAECTFIQKIYKDSICKRIVNSFYSIKYSAFIRVTENETEATVMVGHRHRHQAYNPTAFEQFLVTEDQGGYHISPITITNPPKYLDYDTRRTKNVTLSIRSKGFRTVSVPRY